MKTIKLTIDEMKALPNYFDVDYIKAGVYAKFQHSHPHCPPSVVFIDKIDQPHDNIAHVYWHFVNMTNGVEGSNWATQCMKSTGLAYEKGYTWYPSRTLML